MQRRKNYLIKKKFQFNFISGFLILLLLESVLIAGLSMYISKNTITTGYLGSILRIETTPNFFSASFVLIILIVAVGTCIAGIAIFTLLSHRIVGPLYRFEKALKDITDGDLTTRINLRKTDQLTELKEAVNILVNSLDRRMGRIKNSLLEIQNLTAAKGDPETASKLNKALANLKDEIGHFKVTSDLKE